MDKLPRERKSLEARLNRASSNVQKLQNRDDVDDVDIQTELDNVVEIWMAYMSVHKRMVDNCDNKEMDEVLKHQAEFESIFAPLKSTLLKLRKRYDGSLTRNEAASQDGGGAVQQLAQTQAEFIRLFSSNFNMSANVDC